MAVEVGGRRRDAGTVRVSERDAATLRVIGETGGARLSLLGQLLAIHGGQSADVNIRPTSTGQSRSDSATRGWVGRMVRGGYVRQVQLLRATWVTVTPAGARVAGLVDGQGRPTPRVVEAATQADHTNTVGLLRLHLEHLHPDATWIPERTYWLEQETSKATFRRPDGALEFDGRTVGIEVELTAKRPEKYGAIIGWTHHSLTEVWWYCPPEMAAWLGRTLAAAAVAYESSGLFTNKQATPWDVRPLPEGVRP